MNVLAKIVIPKTNVTLVYINNELEELAREEFFRLKKVLEIKRRLKEGKEEKRPVNHEVPRKRKPKITPPEEVQVGKCIICGDVIKEEPISEEDKLLQDEKLEELKAQINEIMNMTRGLNEEGILPANVNEFLRTAEDLKLKLETSEESLDFEQISIELNLEELCYDCKMKYLEDHKKKVEPEEALSSLGEQLLTSQESKVPGSPDLSHITGVTIKEPSKDTIRSAKTPQPGTSELYSQTQSDIELGTFEVEEKEIIKIKRIKNEDGTYSEQKKVIKIKKEVKAPVRGKSTTSNANSRVTEQQSDASRKPPYSGSKTIGLVGVNSWVKAILKNSSHRKAKSVPITTTSHSVPLERFCMSSALLSLANSDTNFASSSDEFIAISLNNSHQNLSLNKTNDHSQNISDQSFLSRSYTISDKELLLKIKDTSRPFNTAIKSQTRLNIPKNKPSRSKIKQSVSFYA